MEDDYFSYRNVPNWLKSQGYLDHSNNDTIDDFADLLCLDPNLDQEEKNKIIFEAIEKENIRLIKVKTENAFEKRQLLFDDLKEENKVWNDFDRGKIIGEISVNPKLPSKQELKLHYQIDKYIEWQFERYRMGELKESSFDKLSRGTEEFKKWSQNQHIKELENNEIPLAYHSFLKQQVLLFKETNQSEGFKGITARDRMYYFKRFVFWLEENELIQSVSKVYHSKTLLKFSVDPSMAQPIPLEDVNKIYHSAPDRLKLCILLMLNCGYGAAEIASLRKSEVDFNAGRIVRKRGKAKRHEQTPTVSYKLWERTLELLKKEHEKSIKCLKENWEQKEQSWKLSEIEDLILLNNNCSPIWHNRINEATKKSQRTDCVRNDWNALLIKLKAGYLLCSC